MTYVRHWIARCPDVSSRAAGLDKALGESECASSERKHLSASGLRSRDEIGASPNERRGTSWMSKLGREQASNDAWLQAG